MQKYSLFTVILFFCLLTETPVCGWMFRVGVIMDKEETLAGANINFLNNAMDVLNHKSNLKISYSPIFYSNNTFR